MTITRVWQAGAETGSAAEFDSSSGAEVVTTKYTGDYGYRMHSDNWKWGRAVIPATRQVRVGCHFHGGGPHSVGNIFYNIVLKTSGGTRIAYTAVRSNMYPAIYIYNSSDAAVTGKFYKMSQWMHLGIDVKIDSSSGWFTLYINGIQELEWTGNTGNSDISWVEFGANGQHGGAGYYQHWDDLYIDDSTGESSASPLPINRFFPLTLDGNGNYAQWLGSDGNSTDNYLLLDERGPSTSDYVVVSGANLNDSYTMSNYSYFPSDVTYHALIPTIYGYRGESTEEIAIGTRYSSTDVVGSGQAPPTASYNYLFERQTTKPGGGSWDETSVNGAELLIKSGGTY